MGKRKNCLKRCLTFLLAFTVLFASIPMDGLAEYKEQFGETATIGYLKGTKDAGSTASPSDSAEEKHDTDLEDEAGVRYSIGDPDDLKVEITGENTGGEARITVLASPSDAGIENGVIKISDISLVDFQSEGETGRMDFENREGTASSSDAGLLLTDPLDADIYGYQVRETEGKYVFSVEEDGLYTFSVRYERFEEGVLSETQIFTSYQLDTAVHGMPGDIRISSNIHGSEDGKTLDMPTTQTITGVLSVVYDLPEGMTDRVLKFSWPSYVTPSAYPTSEVVKRYTTLIDGKTYTCLQISDSANGQMTFDIVYTVKVGNIDIASYLEAGGRYPLGRIHVISSGREGGMTADLSEAELGPFVTEKNPETEKPKISGWRSDSIYPVSSRSFSAIYHIGTEEFINGPYPISDSTYYSWNTVTSPVVYSGKAPYIVQKVRIYAPENFRFYTTEYERYHIGIDSEGNGFLETSNINGSGLFKNVWVIPQDGFDCGKGVYYAPPAVIYYRSYGGEEKEVSCNSPVSLMTINHALNEDVSWTLEPYRTTIQYQEGTTGPVYPTDPYDVKLSNVVKYDNDRGIYIIPPKNEYRVMMEYPEELQLQELRFAYDTSSLLFQGMEKSISKVVLHLSDGSEREAALSDSVAKSPLENREVHIDSAEIIFDSLRGYACEIKAIYEAGSIDEEKNVKAATTVSANGVEKTVETNYLIKKLPVLNRLTTSCFMGSFIAGNNQSDVITGGVRIEYSTGVNQYQKLTNPKISFNSGSIVDKFNGLVTIYSNEFVGGKISFRTSYGTSGEYEIRNKGENLRYAALAEDEKITEISLSKEGRVIFNPATGVNTFAYFGMSLSYRELSEAYGLDEPAVTLSGSLQLDSDEKEAVYNTSVAINLWTPISITGMDYPNTAGSKQNIYQGNSFSYGLTYSGRGNSGIWGDFPFNPVYYVRLINTDKFVFTGVSNQNYKAEIVNRGGEQYLKLQANDTFDTYLDYYGYFTIQIPLNFKVLPGSALGEARPVGKTYIDVGGYRNRLEEILRKTRWKLQFLNLYADENGVTDSGGTVDERLWMTRDPDTVNLQKINILPQSLATVSISPGADGVYSSVNSQSFQPDKRRNLSAMITMSAGDDAISDYTSYIKIPRKGQEVIYSESGSQMSVRSDYNMYLTDPPQLYAGNTGVSIVYRLEGGSDYLSADLIGDRWHDVAEIKLYTHSMPGRLGATLRLNLEAEEKDNLGLGEWKAYMVPEYSQNGNESLYGAKVIFNYQDYQITGKTWFDQNENGRYDSREPFSNQSVIELLQNGRNVSDDAYRFQVTNGNYRLSTYLEEKLSLRFSGITGYDQEIKPAMQKSSSNQSTSVFSREGQKEDNSWIAELPEHMDGNQTNLDLGIVVLPVLSAGNVKVSYKSIARANATVSNQPNAPDVNRQITYHPAADMTVAQVFSSGIIEGLRANGLTTATATVRNSLGDEVTAQYQIAVSDNEAPVLEVHPWVAIEGDQIPDLWKGVIVEDPEEEYPDWAASRSVAENKKKVELYRNSDFTEEIYLDDALNANGIYYVRYSVEDDKENITTADTTLIVYGRICGETVSVKHYFDTGETIPIPAADYYYLDANDTEVPVSNIISMGPTEWTLSEGTLAMSVQLGVHPRIGDVSQGVSEGGGRYFRTIIKGSVDSKVVVADDKPYRQILVGEFATVGWEERDAVYRHWGLGAGDDRDGSREVTSGNGVAMPSEFVQDTSKPCYVTYYKHSASPELYDNLDARGNRLSNSADVVEVIRVIGKPEVQAEAVIYVTPEEAEDEAFVRGKLNALALYHDGENDRAPVPAENLSYRYYRTREEITSVDITAWAGRMDNQSAPFTVRVEVRSAPVLTVKDLHIREGQAFIPDQGHDKMLVPENEQNTYQLVSSNVDSSRIGKYQVIYRTMDALTGAGSYAYEIVYVHGNPVILASENSLYTHESRSESALAEAVRTGRGNAECEAASAYVEYVLPDNTIKRAAIATDQITYQVDHYVPLTAGIYTVTAVVDDSSVLSEVQKAGFAPAATSRAVSLKIEDRIYAVRYETGEHGQLESPANALATVAHGNTVIVPALAFEEGYELDYWLDEDGNEIADLSKVAITENRVFTAKFKRKEFMVRFMGVYGRIIKTEFVKYGDDATPPLHDYEVTSKLFYGWSEDYHYITSDKDIWVLRYTSEGGSSGNGNENGSGVGGGSVPSGPGIEKPAVPESSAVFPENSVIIKPEELPLGDFTISYPYQTSLPNMGDKSERENFLLGYRVDFVEGSSSAGYSEESSPLSEQEEVSVSSDAGDEKRCVLHLVFMLIAMIELLYYFIKWFSNFRKLRKLREELNKSSARS